MKTFFSICLIATVFACGNSKSDAVRAFIPGTYVRHTTHEMGREWDTLEISRFSEGGNNYSILRRWAYERKLDGISQPLDYKLQDEAALYDEDKMVLMETSSGRILSFAPEKNLLFSGTNEYRKIK
jgi:hypothetical protein